MSKKGKRASGKKYVPSKRSEILLESLVGRGASSFHYSRRDGRNHNSLRNNRRKGPVLKIVYNHDNPHLGRWKAFPVINIHTRRGAKNLSVRKHNRFVLRMMDSCKDEGHEVILFLHGRSRSGGWICFLKKHFECAPFKYETKKVHPGITKVYLN